MSGYFWGYRWIATEKGLVARAWDRLFKNRAPRQYELRDAATLLKQLAESPRACAYLASALDVTVDGNESPADVVSQMANEAADDAMAVHGQMEINRIRRETARRQN